MLVRARQTKGGRKKDVSPRLTIHGDSCFPVPPIDTLPGLFLGDVFRGPDVELDQDEKKDKVSDAHVKLFQEFVVVRKELAFFPCCVCNENRNVPPNAQEAGEQLKNGVPRPAFRALALGDVSQVILKQALVHEHGKRCCH